MHKIISIVAVFMICVPDPYVDALFFFGPLDDMICYPGRNLPRSHSVIYLVTIVIPVSLSKCYNTYAVVTFRQAFCQLLSSLHICAICCDISASDPLEPGCTLNCLTPRPAS